jgi:hypothetical protein
VAVDLAVSYGEEFGWEGEGEEGGVGDGWWHSGVWDTGVAGREVLAGVACMYVYTFATPLLLINSLTVPLC